MIPPERHEEERAILERLRLGERVEPLDTVRVARDGQRLDVSVSVSAIRDAAGRVVGGCEVARDITERARREEAFRVALREKEAALVTYQTLLRESNHRLKNNLQMVCDLLYLQASTLGAAQAQAVLDEAYGRIFAIARLHEQFCQSLETGEIDLAEYLGRLVSGFRAVYPRVRLSFEAPASPLAVEVERAMHVGLIVNELVTNAVKHAFPDGQGQVAVRLKSAGVRLELQVHDDGTGLPASTDLARAKSLGLRLVGILAGRLEATVIAENRAGACFTVTFPLRAEVPIGPAEA